MSLQKLYEIKYVYSENLINEADKNPAVRGRASLTHNLIKSYGLCRYLRKIEPKVCNPADLRAFHASDFVDKLRTQGGNDDADIQIPKNHDDDEVEDKDNSDVDSNSSLVEEYGLGFDCPVWPGIMKYACTIAGATMSACEDLCKSPANKGAQKIIINWTGGWHHAHRNKASGYCYVNDIVLGILVLRTYFKRVLYIDLDVHHGNGVEEAFEVTQRVFTLSFHKYECGYYPGTGKVEECGRFGRGKGYSANFPYRNGITGEKFCKYFKRIFAAVCTQYQPDVCVLQCGADSIVGDPLGGTNLTPDDIVLCVKCVLSRNLPTLLLGGGGYNFLNASRFWTQLTAAICKQSLSEDIPENCVNFLRYGPDYSLKISKKAIILDENSEEYLNDCATIIEGNLRANKVTAI